MRRGAGHRLKVLDVDITATDNQTEAMGGNWTGFHRAISGLFALRFSEQ